MKKDNAFVTVEYSLLLPILFLIYAVLIYVGIYQYNECLLQNDAFLYAIEGEEAPYSDKYILVEEMGMEMEQVEVERHSPENVLRICKRLKDEQ